MAKALMGHVTNELRSTPAASVENRRLRRRIEDLESMVLRLQADNDRLEAAARERARETARAARPASRAAEDLQPA